MDAHDRMLIEWELTRLNLAFFRHLDVRDYDTLVEMILPEGLIHWTAGTTRGRDELRARTASWPDLTVRHVVTNHILSDVTAESASGEALLTVFAGPATGAEGTPARFQGEPHLSQVIDRYARTAEGWRIAERRFVNLLLGAQSPAQSIAGLG